MVKQIEVSAMSVKYLGTDFPFGQDVSLAESLWNFFHTVDKLSPITGVEPYIAILVVDERRVDVYCQASDPLSFAVDVSTLTAFSKSLADKVVSILQDYT